MSQDSEVSRRRLEIDWIKAVAGALAAMVSAVLLSTLGAAGTLIGAAIGSLVVTVSSALFTQGLNSGTRGLTKAQQSARQNVGVARAEMYRAERAEDTRARDSHLAHAEERLTEANDELDSAVSAAAEAASLGWRERVRELPWKRILLVSLAFFLIAMAAITILELLAGRSVASVTGGTTDDHGTTIGNVVGGQPASEGTPGGNSTESPSPTSTVSPTTEPTSEAPTSTPPTETPTPSPTETSTETPSPAQEAPQGTAGTESP
jgi:ABC-type multidrug transport system fused ATPase/permease subunit